MDVDEEMPPLAPEIKINMKLDDIIKYENIRAGVSHNQQFRRAKGGRKFRPYFKRRYPSQNWRLRGNGPNTPRFRRYQSRFQHASKVRAFLERKWKTTPMNSVFQRLGRNPLQESAKAKIWNARNYYRPQRPQFSFLKRFNPTRDPDRKRKMFESYRLYSENDGLDGLIDMNEPSPILNDVGKKEALSELLGGHITSLKEEEPVPGTLVTTIITRVPIPKTNDYDSLNTGNDMYRNGSHFANGMKPEFNGYAMNGTGSNNNCHATNPMVYGVNGMNARNPSSMYANMQSNQMYANSMSNSSSFTSNGGMGFSQLNGATNGLSRTGTNGNWNQQQMTPRPNEQNRFHETNGPSINDRDLQKVIQYLNTHNPNHDTSGPSTGNLNRPQMTPRLNEENGIHTNGPSNWSGQQVIPSLIAQKPVNDTNKILSGSYGQGIQHSLPFIHATARSNTSRFGGPSTARSEDSSELMQ